VSTTQASVNKHPIRGAIWGLVAGIGLALLLIAYSVIALGTLMPYLVVVVMIVLGVLYGSVGPARSGREPEEPPVDDEAGD